MKNTASEEHRKLAERIEALLMEERADEVPSLLEERERTVRLEGKLEGLEEAAKIAADEWELDEHNEGHPEFFAKYGCIDVDDAIRKRIAAFSAEVPGAQVSGPTRAAKDGDAK